MGLGVGLGSDGREVLVGDLTRVDGGRGRGMEGRTWIVNAGISLGKPEEDIIAMVVGVAGG